VTQKTGPLTLGKEGLKYFTRYMSDTFKVLWHLWVYLGLQQIYNVV